MKLANECLTIQSSDAGDVGKLMEIVGSDCERIELNGVTPVVTSKPFKEITNAMLLTPAAGTVTVKKGDGTVVVEFRPGETARPADVVKPGLTTVRNPPKALHGEPGFDFGSGNLEDFTLTERHTAESHDQPLAYGTPHPTNSRLFLIGQKLTDGEENKRIHVRVYAARLKAEEQVRGGYSVTYPQVAREFPKVQWAIRIAKADYEGMAFSQTCLVPGYTELKLVEELFTVDAVGVFGTLTLGYEKVPGPAIPSMGYDERGDLETTITQTVLNGEDPPVEQMGYLFNLALTEGIDSLRATRVTKTVVSRTPLWTEEVDAQSRHLMRFLYGVTKTTKSEIVPVGTPPAALGTETVVVNGVSTTTQVLSSVVKDKNKWQAEKTTTRVDGFLALGGEEFDRSLQMTRTATVEAVVPAGSTLDSPEVKAHLGGTKANGRFTLNGTLADGNTVVVPGTPGKIFQFKTSGSASGTNTKVSLSLGIGSVKVKNGGTGFTSPPTVMVQPDLEGGTPAVLKAVMATGFGSVKSLTINPDNSGYMVAPPLEIPWPDPNDHSRGRRAQGSVKIGEIGVSSLEVKSYGAGYTGDAVLTFDPPSDPSGRRATGTAKLINPENAGQVTFRVRNGGKNYTDNAVLVVTPAAGDEGNVTQAAGADLIIEDGSIVGFRNEIDGGGYTKTPTATVTDGWLAEGAAMHARLAPTTADVEIDTHGKLYKTAPAITVTRDPRDRYSRAVTAHAHLSGEREVYLQSSSLDFLMGLDYKPPFNSWEAYIYVDVPPLSGNTEFICDVLGNSYKEHYDKYGRLTDYVATVGFKLISSGIYNTDPKATVTLVAPNGRTWSKKITLKRSSTTSDLIVTLNKDAGYYNDGTPLFDYPPTVTVSGGTASAQAYLFPRGVDYVYIDAQPTVMPTNPVVKFVSANGYGSGAAITVAVVDGAVVFTQANVTPGSGYTDPPIVTLMDSGGIEAVVDATIPAKKLSFEITDRGSKYTITPNAKVTGGGGTGAEVIPIIGGKLTADLTDGGEGYISDFTVTLDAPNKSNGKQAVVNGLVNTGSIDHIEVVDSGSGFLGDKEIEFVSGGRGPQYIAFDGNSAVWVANKQTHNVSKFSVPDGTLMGNYPVGNSPIGVACDGTHVWIGNYGDASVTKLRAADGVLVGTFPVGNNPIGVACDGTHVWVVSQTDGMVKKLLAQTGAVVGTFAVGTNSWGATVVGDNVWIANRGSHNITVLRRSDGQLVGTYSVAAPEDPDNREPAALAFDGTHVWSANPSATNPLAHTVTKHLATDGTIVGVYAVEGDPLGIAFDGDSSIWIPGASTNTVTQLSLDGTLVGTYDVGTYPMGLVYAKTGIWVSNSASNNVTHLYADGGALLGTYYSGGTGAAATGVAAPNVAKAGDDLVMAINGATGLSVSATAKAGTVVFSAKTEGLAGNTITITSNGSSPSSLQLTGGDEGGNYRLVSASVQDIDSVNAALTVVTLAPGAVWPTLTETRVDPEMDVVITESKTLVPRNTTVEHSEIVEGSLVVTESRDSDIWREWKVVTTIPQPAAQSLSTAVVSTETIGYAYPSRINVKDMDLYGTIVGYQKPRATLTPATVKTWWVISNSKPNVLGEVGFQEIQPRSILLNGVTYENVLFDTVTRYNIGNAAAYTFQATAPSYSEYVNNWIGKEKPIAPTGAVPIRYQKLWKCTATFVTMR